MAAGYQYICVSYENPLTSCSTYYINCDIGECSCYDINCCVYEIMCKTLYRYDCSGCAVIGELTGTSYAVTAYDYPSSSNTYPAVLSNSMTPFPTFLPTLNPSIIPSTIPTVGPTVQPTAEPTIKPSFYPTRLPTAAPTLKTGTGTTNSDGSSGGVSGNNDGLVIGLAVALSAVAFILLIVCCAHFCKKENSKSTLNIEMHQQPTPNPIHDTEANNKTEKNPYAKEFGKGFSNEIGRQAGAALLEACIIS